MKTQYLYGFSNFVALPVKAGNFGELGESGKNSHYFHITSFDRNAKKHETREISAYESREIKFAPPLRLLAGVEI